jgi:hypothetical protein
MLRQVGDLFQLNVKLRCQKLTSYGMFTEHIILSLQTRQLHISVLLSLSIIS